MNLSQVAGFVLCGAAFLSAQIPDFTPTTPLFRALSLNDAAKTKALVVEGAGVNEGRYIGFTPIFFTIFNQNPELMRYLISKGADVRAIGPADATPLMWAAANETGGDTMVRMLLKAGADPHAKNKMGETALQWAMKRGHTPAVEALIEAGAVNPDEAKQAVERALALLQKSGAQFVRVSGCSSCHHQSLPQMAIGAARKRGFAVNDKISGEQVAAVIATFKPATAMMMKGTEAIPDTPISVSYALLGLHAEGYAPDETTAAMAHVISTKQTADGSFRSLPARPPMESSDFTATALSIRALQLYGKNPGEMISRARHWLIDAKPMTMEEKAMRLMGLAWSKADTKTLDLASRELLADQRGDGGWAQLDTLETDAYATGQALTALRIAGSTADPAIARGNGFLLRTQLPDGSWHVRARVFPFQPYKDSGFPHGKDQWISAAGTSWAALALTYSRDLSLVVAAAH